MSRLILFLFVDGVGVGARDPAVNPLARRETLLSRFLDGSGTELPAGGVAGEADASLGVAGRPQSATGHTTILTGQNAPALLGKHLLGFPNAALRELLSREGLFGALEAAGLRGAYANAYHCGYLDALGLRHEHTTVPEPPLPVAVRRLRQSASTAAVAAAGQEFRTFDHLRRGEAVFHDITSAQLRQAGCEVPACTPEEAAESLLQVGAAQELVMFEYFLTDMAGHAQSFEAADEALERVDRLLRGLVAGLRPGDGLLCTSDHGNLEDLSVRGHTLGKVPVLGFGSAAAAVPEIRSLLDVRPALMALAGAR